MLFRSLKLISSYWSFSYQYWCQDGARKVVAGEPKSLQSFWCCKPAQYPCIPQVLDSDLADLRQCWDVEFEIHELGEQILGAAAIRQCHLAGTIVKGWVRHSSWRTPLRGGCWTSPAATLRLKHACSEVCRSRPASPVLLRQEDGGRVVMRGVKIECYMYIWGGSFLSYRGSLFSGLAGRVLYKQRSLLIIYMVHIYESYVYFSK